MTSNSAFIGYFSTTGRVLHEPCRSKIRILYSSSFVSLQRCVLPKLLLFTGKQRISASGETVVVFGGSGRLGRRVVGELIKQNYRVAAGGRNVERTKQVVQERIDNVQQSNLVEFFECNVAERANWFQKWSPDSVKAVVAVIGASGSSILDFTQPYKIDYLGNKKLIDATRAWNPNCPFILITSLGTGKPFTGFPAALLNLYGGILYWKRKSERYLIQSGLPFTIIRPGGLERAKDDFGVDHKVRLYPANSQFSGSVSRLQVAQVIADAISNPYLSRGKIVEVIALYGAKEIPLQDQWKRITV
ncbi:Protein TIC 62, chloroplastic [Galdieria sulphuraria]|nr:Protein TIC 62, chloroplastic [Galdieria sulphuraria]